MSSLIGVLVLTTAMMLQTAIFSRLPLLNGTTDIVLIILAAWGLQENVKLSEVIFWGAFAVIFVSFVSVVPAAFVLIAYTFLLIVVRWLQRRIWQAPVLGMFFSIILGTVFQQMLHYFGLRYFNGVPLPFDTSFLYIMLPSLVLNLLFTLPVFLLIKDITDWLHPMEDE
ncbi:MAG: hypothetical protein JW750_11695 [Anaerolineaceae bacterium]|nr:hypothetical protein [Anaerolineaceae bacterium]